MQLWLIQPPLQKINCYIMNEQMINTLRDYFATQPIEKAWLFGSYSRGEQTEESDVDILVTFDDKAKVSLLSMLTF